MVGTSMINLCIKIKNVALITIILLSTSIFADDSVAYKKIKQLNQNADNHCFIKIITTTNGNKITKEEKLVCADGRKNFDEPGYWELFSEFYYRDNNTPEYCRAYARPNHAFKLYGKVCLDKTGKWRVK